MTQGVEVVKSDYEAACQFVAALTGDPQTDITVQTFMDCGDYAETPPVIMHGPIGMLWADIEDRQDEGHGVFVMVNEGDGKGRAAKNVKALRALFLDDDHNTVSPQMLTGCFPNIVVHSGRGVHYYWRLSEGEKMGGFTAAQKALAGRFGTDAKVCDLPRVMRLPGTVHYKNRSDPKTVDLLVAERRSGRTIAYILDQLGAALATPGTPALAPNPGRRVLSSLPLADKRKRALAYVTAIKAVKGEGRDNTAFKVACSLLRSFDLPYDEAWKILCEWNLTCSTPPKSERELSLKLENARRYATGVAGKMYDAENVVAEVVAKSAGGAMDPSGYCYDMTRANAPWRYWKNQAWQEGVATASLDRMLENAGLDKPARDCWKRNVAVVNDCRPVYDARDKLVMDGGEMIANTYRPPTLVPEEGDFSPALLVLENLCGGDAAVERWLMGWLAKLVQSVYAGKPARIGVAPVFFGQKGSGKGVLETLCRSLLGDQNVVSIGQAELSSQFNGWMENALLVFCDEVFSSDSKASAISAKMKNLITAHVLSLDVKGQPQRQAASVANFILASNSHRPIESEQGDRRFTVIRTGPPIGPDLGAEVADDARAGGPITRAFLDFLLKIPAELLAQDYRPLHTAAKDEVQRASGNSATRFALEVSERGFSSLTSAFTFQGGKESDLYLRSEDGLRRLAGVPGPLVLRRSLMAVFRAYAQEVGAPATSEGTLMAALKEVIPSVREATVEVAGKLERVIAGLPGAVRDGSIYAEAESTSTQATMF